ncbi:DUF805 domain-containing protein [Rhodoferax sp.]|uniref:DUF805 domain-containing protein n=1 Tax=Rhodoferax sp. TaxID=50421 RepID=UPI00374D0DD9
MDFVRLLFSYRGRINRARFLAVQLALLALWLLLLIKAPFQQGEILSWVVTIAMIWINLATMAKRLHDRDRNGLAGNRDLRYQPPLLPVLRPVLWAAFRH